MQQKVNVIIMSRGYSELVWRALEGARLAIRRVGRGRVILVFDGLADLADFQLALDDERVHVARWEHSIGFSRSLLRLKELGVLVCGSDWSYVIVAGDGSSSAQDIYEAIAQAEPTTVVTGCRSNMEIRPPVKRLAARVFRFGVWGLFPRDLDVNGLTVFPTSLLERLPSTAGHSTNLLMNEAAEQARMDRVMFRASLVASSMRRFPRLRNVVEVLVGIVRARVWRIRWCVSRESGFRSVGGGSVTRIS